MEETAEGDLADWSVLLAQTGGPLTFEIIFGLLGVLLLLAASAMISGSEVAYFSITGKEIEDLKSDGSKSSSRILKLLDTPRHLLATILIVNNTLNVAIIIISYYLISYIIDVGSYPIIGFLLEVVIVTFLIVLFGEVIPKIFAAHNNVRIARFMSAPLRLLLRLLKPASYLLVSSTRVIERKLDNKSGSNISLEEVDHAIDVAVGEKATQEEVDMLKSIVNFGSISVTQVMQARVDVTSLSDDTGFHEVMRIVLRDNFSRIPVYRENEDNVIGILYIKDLLRHVDEPDEFRWQDLLRQPFFVPESKKIDDLLKEFQTKRIHMAIVVDEYGGTSGIITLEDVMEEIIGEIADEFDDVQEIEFTKLDDHNFIFEGKTMLNDMFKVVDVEPDSFDDVEGDFDSIAGLVLELAGRLPEKGAEITHKNFTFTVVSVSKKRIIKVKLTLRTADQTPAENEQE
jgi:gliding motility-associated protein GldE